MPVKLFIIHFISSLYDSQAKQGENRNKLQAMYVACPDISYMNP